MKRFIYYLILIFCFRNNFAMQDQDVDITLVQQDSNIIQILLKPNKDLCISVRFLNRAQLELGVLKTHFDYSWLDNFYQEQFPIVIEYANSAASAKIITIDKDHFMGHIKANFFDLDEELKKYKSSFNDQVESFQKIIEDFNNKESLDLLPGKILQFIVFIKRADKEVLLQELRLK